MLKNLLFILFLSFVFNTLYAQERHTNTALIETAPGWYKVKPGHNITTSRFLESSASHLGLSPNDHLAIRRQDSDAIGFIHTRIYQQYKGIKVWGAEMVLHEKDNKLVSLNGEFVKGLELSTVPSIDGSRAIQLAIAFSGARKFAWGNDENHDFYPKAELLIAQKDFNQKPEDYRLVYKVNVFGIEPFDSKDYFIDAHSGQLLFTLDRIRYTDVPGIAHTKYAGVRNFITDSVGPNHYELRSTTTLNQVTTFDMNQGWDFINSLPFTDSNNVWNNFNPQQDEAATDVHWGNQVTMDFFYNRYGVYVNNGFPLNNYVHVGHNRAFAGMEGSYIFYGDGDSVSSTSWTSLDVVAHELTHSLLRYGPNFSYKFESGALEESFADIFGLAVQFEYDSLNAEFTTGRQFFLNNQIQRSFEDPKVKQHPDTYKGQYWYTGTNNYDWLHSNNAVQNHWYYLLSVGDTGINDNNYSYALPGIGRRNAENIAFRNMMYYLTSTAGYQDARLGSIFAAEDLYGTCSVEMLETAKAWKAVGVGEEIKNRDLAILDIINPVTSCALSANEDFQILLRNFGCRDTLYSGDTVEVFYKFNNLPTVKLSHQLTSDLLPGDSLTVSDPQALNLSNDTSYILSAWVNLPADGSSENDSVFRLVTNNGVYQNSDFEIIRAQPYYIVCGVNDPNSVSSTLRFWGCDSIAAGDTVYVGVKAYNSSGHLSQAIDTIVLGHSLYRGDELYTYQHTNRKFVLGANRKYGEVMSWVYHPDDINRTNDTVNPLPFYQPNRITRDRPIAMHNLENSITSRDSMFLRAQGRYSRQDSFATVEFMPGVGANGTQGLQFSGERKWFDTDTVTRYDSLYYLPIGYGRSEVCFCLQTWQWPGDSLFLEFDLRQTASKVWENTFNKDFKNSSKLWVSRNQSRISEIFYPQTFTQDKFVHHKIDLTSQLGQAFELCLRAENFITASLDTVAGSLGDNVFIDNIYIHDENHHVGLLETALVEKPIEIYPNPTDGEVSIHLLAGQQGNVQATIYNSALLTVKSTELYLGEGENEFVLDLSSLPTGVYTIKLLGNGFQATEKLVVK